MHVCIAKCGDGVGWDQGKFGAEWVRAFHRSWYLVGSVVNMATESEEILKTMPDWYWWTRTWRLILQTGNAGVLASVRVQ